MVSHALQVSCTSLCRTVVSMVVSTVLIFPKSIENIEQSTELIPSLPHKISVLIGQFYSAVVWVAVLQERSKPQKSPVGDDWSTVEMSPSVVIAVPIPICARVIYLPSVVGFVWGACFFVGCLDLVFVVFFPLNSRWNQEIVVFWNNHSILEAALDWFWHCPVFIELLSQISARLESVVTWLAGLARLRQQQTSESALCHLLFCTEAKSKGYGFFVHPFTSRVTGLALRTARKENMSE